MQQASKIMREHSLRFLPVMQGSQLVGVLSERDLQLVLAIEGVDAGTFNVEDAMSERALTPDIGNLLDMATLLQEHLTVR